MQLSCTRHVEWRALECIIIQVILLYSFSHIGTLSLIPLAHWCAFLTVWCKRSQYPILELCFLIALYMWLQLTVGNASFTPKGPSFFSKSSSGALPSPVSIQTNMYSVRDMFALQYLKELWIRKFTYVLCVFRIFGIFFIHSLIVMFFISWLVCLTLLQMLEDAG